MLSPQQIESLRRSSAMAPLAPSQVAELLESCSQMAKERVAIAAILADLPESFAAVRGALNELKHIVG